MKTLALIVLVAIVGLLLAGCGSGGNGSPTLGNGSIVSPVPAGGKVVTSSVTAIEEWIAVEALAPGTIVQVRLNRSLFEVREYDAVIQNTDNGFGEHIVVCKMANGVVVGNGDSGSPVLHNGKVIAALCYGLAYGDNLTFGARSIRDVIALSGDIAQSTKSAKFRMIGSQKFVPMELAKFNTMKDKTKLLKIAGTRSAHPALIPGMSIAICELEGPAMVGVVGTVSYIDGTKIYVFGHAYNMNGDKNATPATLASMQTMGDGGAAGAQKLITVTDIGIGTFTNDQYTGGLIQTDVVAKTYPVTIKTTVDGQVKSDIVETFAVHDWQVYGLEYYNVTGVTDWVLSRQVGITTPGSTTGTFSLDYPGSTNFSASISLPKVGATTESTDIAYETANEFSDLLAKNQQKWMSPTAITMNAVITTGPTAKVWARIIGSDGYAVTSSGSDSYSLAVGTYIVQAWVPGWTKYTFTLTSPGELNPLFLNQTGFKAVAAGSATVNVTVTNLVTGGQLTLNPPLQIQVYDNGSMDGKGALAKKK